MHRTAGVGLFLVAIALSATADDLASGVTLLRSVAAEVRWKK
jgi:hypothetical protein